MGVAKPLPPGSRLGACLLVAAVISWLAFAPGPASGEFVARPGAEEGSTRVWVSVFLVDIDEIDSAAQSFTANLYLEARWRDEALAHEHPGPTTHRLSDVWTPRIQLVNQQRLWKTFDEIVEVSPAGDVFHQQRYWGQFSQPLDLRRFPFDEQRFEVHLIAAVVAATFLA